MPTASAPASQRWYFWFTDAPQRSVVSQMRVH